MTPTRAALVLPAAVLVLSGCGAVATATAHNTTDSYARTDAAPHTVAPVTSPATAAPAPATPAAHASQPDIVVTVPISSSSGTEWLEILNAAGTVLAKTEIDPTVTWMTAAGAGGAYWAQDGQEHELTPSGAVRTLGAVPADANAVLIAPDGASYAYATSDTAKDGIATNRIVVVAPGAAPRVIADRTSDPNHPTSDAPPDGWNYYLISWTAPGIAFARVPSGGCGCGSFDMQMQSADSAVINPATDVVTTLTADSLCPLSAVSPSLETVCFAGTTATDAIRIGSRGALVHNFTLSGSNVAGDAVFASGSAELAYITIPESQDTCGATITPTLRILNLSTGAAVARNSGDFAPMAWPAGGPILGEMTSGANTWVATVDPATFATTELTTAAAEAQFVGIM